MNPTKPTRRWPALAAAIAVLIAALALLLVYRMGDSRAMLMPDRVITVLPEPKPLTPFALGDQDGNAFGLSRLQGKWSFVFFGYTYCPDICPTTLAVLSQARRQMLRDGTGEDVQVVFVSVDPHRDTPGKLKQYVGYFDPSFIGVSGEETQIAGLAAQLGAGYQAEYAPGTENYPVYHSSAVFLLDPQARYQAVFSAPLDARAISGRFAGVRRFASGATR